MLSVGYPRIIRSQLHLCQRIGHYPRPHVRRKAGLLCRKAPLGLKNFLDFCPEIAPFTPHNWHYSIVNSYYISGSGEGFTVSHFVALYGSIFYRFYRDGSR